MDMKKIGILIADRRKALHITQETLGEKLAVSAKAVSKWERGISCPDVSLLSRICVELKISLAELLSGTINQNLSSNTIDPEEEIQQYDPFASTFEKIHFAPSDAGVIVSPYLFGNNLEHTRSSVYNGISAQMLRNRKFAGMPSAMEGMANEWRIIGKKTYAMLVYRNLTLSWGTGKNAIVPIEPYVRHDERYHMNRHHELNYQQLSNYENGAQSGMCQNELFLQADKRYQFAICVWNKEISQITVSLSDRARQRVYAEQTISLKKNGAWERYEFLLDCTASDPEATLSITFSEKGSIAVGAVSLMDKNNFRGMRKDVIEKMKKMGIKLLRWPGGNFAGEYNWFDGLMPVDMRAPFESCMGLETQPHSMCYDFHELNTDDFVALCREIGAEPFLTINLAWNTPEENAMWVEYCNGDETTEWGKVRIARGYREPYNVMLWSLGNEFGYGHMEGENNAYGYSRLAAENAKKMLAVCKNLTFCSSGPYPNAEWTEHSAKPLSKVSSFVSVHSYTAPAHYFFTDKVEQDYTLCISRYLTGMKKLLQTRAQLPDHIKISYDEWNVWYGWYRPSSVTDGIYAALLLHMVISVAERLQVEMACHFEAVHESAIKVTSAGSKLTALGCAIGLIAQHANGQLCYASHTAAVTTNGTEWIMTVVNPLFDTEKVVEIPQNCVITEATEYTSANVLPHSNFEPHVRNISSARFTLPPHSMLLLKGTFA